MKSCLAALVGLLFGLFSPIAEAQPPMSSSQPGAVSPVPPTKQTVEPRLIADRAAVAAGQTVRLGVEFDIEPGWHIYYKQSGQSGRPTSIIWQLPSGSTAGDLLWEKPKQFDQAGITTYGYSKATVIAADITVPQGLNPGDTFTVKAQVIWLACKDTCEPGRAVLELSLPVVAAGSPQLAQIPGGKFDKVGFTGDLDNLEKEAEGGSVLDGQLQVQQVEDTSQISWLRVFALALLGGALLNLMPCVLPVLSIKVFSFMRQAGDDKSRVFKMGLAYTAGTLAMFVVLALIVIGVQAAGHTIGWGFQFQHPLFVVGMIVLLTVLSLSLFGVFYLNAPGGGELDKLAGKDGYSGAFFKGAVATILATPCSAPFLGTALGFAFAQPWWGVLTIFLAVGLGMSLPTLLLTWRHEWMRFLPKPGVWMERFKEAMGFLMLGSVAWLLWVLGKQAGADAVALTVVTMLLSCIVVWLVTKFAGYENSRRSKIVAYVLAVVVAGGALKWCVLPVTSLTATPPAATSSTTGGITFEPFSKTALDQHLADGKIVFIDFTADWCLTCKVNETTILQAQSVQDAMRRNNVVVLKADWTNGDPQITALLNKFGRSGVPLYVVFHPTRPTKPIVLPEILTTQTVIDALNPNQKP